MENNYDFYSMGIRYAKDYLIDLREKAELIGKQYGMDAKMEFEAGICVTVPAYSNISETTISQRDAENATTKFDENNMSNNSYFGGVGISSQKKNGIYNEPNINKVR